MTRTSDQVAGETAARQKRERLEASRDHQARDTRHRPEDSSRSIRRLLGYADGRPPRTWTYVPGPDGQPELVEDRH